MQSFALIPPSTMYIYVQMITTRNSSKLFDNFPAKSGGNFKSQTLPLWIEKHPKPHENESPKNNVVGDLKTIRLNYIPLLALEKSISQILMSVNYLSLKSTMVSLFCSSLLFAEGDSENGGLA